MKRLFTIILTIGIAASVSAQKRQLKSKLTETAKATTHAIFENTSNKAGNIPALKKERLTPVPKGEKNGSLVAIGQANNAYGFYLGGRTDLWLDPNLGADGTVSFLHRSKVGNGTPTAATTSGDLLFDYSTDGGTTWSVDQGIIYEPEQTTVDEFPFARYPQGVIYNPTDNFADAYITYHAAATGCGGGGTWCRNVFGASPMNDPAAFVQDNFPILDDNITQEVYQSMHITPSGDTWVIGSSSENGTPHNDSNVVRHGTFNSTTGNFEYTQDFHTYTKTEASLIQGEDVFITDDKVAFSSVDENLGWYATLFHHDAELTPHPYYQIVLVKTTDGGTTWDFDNPITVPLEDIPAFKHELIPDNDFINMIDPPPPADSLWFYRNTFTYNTAFFLDLVVDAEGNPHVITTVHFSLSPIYWDDPTQPFAASTGPGLFAAAHVYSLDGGVSWDGSILEHLNTFRGEWDDISEDNRPQAGINYTGTALVGTWLETDTVAYGTTDNLFPDIHVKMCDLEAGVYTSNVHTTEVVNPGACTFGSTSYYLWDNATEYEIPLAYQELTGPSTDPVNYWYIDNFTIDKATGFATRTKDEGIVGVSSPNSDCGLTDEPVEITIKNFGASAITGFDVCYTVNRVDSIIDADTVTETFTGTINAGMTETYTFSTPADLSSAGVYIVRAFIPGVAHKDEFATSASKFVKSILGPTKPTLETVQVQGVDVSITSDVTNTAFNYQWYGWDGSTSTALPGATDTIYTPMADGSYFLHVEGNGCAYYSDTIAFTFTAFSDATIDEIISPADGCIAVEPEILTITIKNVGNQEIASGASISYSIDGGTAVSENTGEVIPVGGSIDFSFDANPITFPGEGDYSIEVTLPADDNTANDVYATTISKDPKPETPSVIIAGNGTTLISSATSGNQWYSALGPEPGATSQQFTPGGPYHNPYYVIVTNTFGCPSDTSNFVHISINEYNLDQAVNVYPNPASDILTISIQDLDFSKVEIYSIIGEQVMTFDNTNNELRINIEELPEGAYFVRIHTNKGLANKKFNIIR